ncbi:hypothetical protein pb186bvf_004564 [Paramecium bursaria]
MQILTNINNNDNEILYLIYCNIIILIKNLLFILEFEVLNLIFIKIPSQFIALYLYYINFLNKMIEKQKRFQQIIENLQKFQYIPLILGSLFYHIVQLSSQILLKSEIDKLNIEHLTFIFR